MESDAMMLLEEFCKDKVYTGLKEKSSQCSLLSSFFIFLLPLFSPPSCLPSCLPPSLPPFHFINRLYSTVKDLGFQSEAVIIQHLDNAIFYQATLTFLRPFPPEKAMAPHSSTLAWKIPWTEESGKLQSMGSLRVGQDWATSLSLFTFMHWRGNGNPLQYSCLENLRDGGAWWAAIYGVAQSQT